MLSSLLSNLAGAQGYSWTEIVIEGTTVVQAWQINDMGQVAISGTTDGRSGIYLDRTFTQLPPPPEGFQVLALGINNGGVITGGATDTSGFSQGFILVGETYTFFSRDGWENTAGRAIADSGLITGESHNGTGAPYAGFIYDPNTRIFTDATPPGSTNTITQGINNLGRITGHGRDNVIGLYGFVWQQRTIIEGKRELLPFLERLSIDFQTRARGINDSGVVVGFITDAAGRSEGFVGSDALGYQRLVAPGGEIPGNSTYCAGINNAAQVVCYVWEDSTSTPQGAFIGSPVEGAGNVEARPHPASTRDIAPSSGAAEWTNKSREELLVMPTMRP
jgi:hypothetical protein